MALHVERRDWYHTSASPPSGTERRSRGERTPSSLRGGSWQGKPEHAGHAVGPPFRRLAGVLFPPKRHSRHVGGGAVPAKTPFLPTSTPVVAEFHTFEWRRPASCSSAGGGCSHKRESVLACKILRDNHKGREETVCQLKSISPTAFNHLRDLQRLELDSNQLESLPEAAFQQLVNLKEFSEFSQGSRKERGGVWDWHVSALGRARDSACDGGYSGICSRPLGPGQWSELAHRVVAATAGSSVVVGSIEGVEFRVLVDTGASATIISDLIYNILPVRCRPLERVSIPCFAANGSSLAIIGQIRAQISIGDIKLAGPILDSSSLAVPCLLGTDFLAKMPIKILVDQGCIELPSGRRMAFLPIPSHPRMASASVQAFVASTVRIPPGTQMLVPLQLKKPLAPEASAHGILLGPSNAAAKGLDLVAAQTLVAADREPFLQVLNVGLSTTVIPQGTVLAHTTPVPLGTGVVGHVHDTPQVPPLSESDERWLDALCTDTGDLSHSQRNKLRALLREFSDVFSKSKFDIGCTKLLRHHIDTGDAAPIRQNPFRLSPAEKQHVKSAVDDMLEADIISPSTSPWGAPIVLVKKHDGSLRFCVDFRRLNKISVADAYPLPRMDESLDALAGAHYFSTLDLLSGFWQLPLDESSKPKTAFRTPQGLFEFNRLPMGLHSAPATFQRLMELVLAGLQWDSCLIYLDDVIVFSRTFSEHIERLCAVFLKMRAANLKFKRQKCHLLRESVRYLGHIVSRSGISTDPEKTKCVQHWPTPTSAGDVRNFIGFASYYRRFVAGFATIAKPLHALTSKGVAFHWGDAEQAVFDSLRNALVTAPSLAYPDFSVPFVLDTDASNTGIGGVLSQKVDGIERVVAYGSRVLSLAEQRYCVTRCELLAIVFFIQQYKPYLYGQHFTVRSDHSALQYALRVDQPSGQLSRWLKVLQDYDFNVTYPFNHLRDLQRLELDSNQLESLPEAAFQQLVNLKELSELSQGSRKERGGVTGVQEDPAAGAQETRDLNDPG
ncbi:uncharacterized protein LOC142905723 [Petromyzon marinus]|uniref:uncharacterized protein LOC142905723 n=1 Tax=Petromyzon marinus TaxID=7757 RepID=UPI003F7033E9